VVDAIGLDVSLHERWGEPGVRAPRTGAFNAAPDADAPKWLVPHRALADAGC